MIMFLENVIWLFVYAHFKDNSYVFELSSVSLNERFYRDHSKVKIYWDIFQSRLMYVDVLLSHVD